MVCVSRALYASVATSVEIATPTRRAANTRPRMRFETRVVSRAPASPPSIDEPAKHATIAPTSGVSVSEPDKARETRPKAAVITITSRDVADARFIG